MSSHMCLNEKTPHAATKCILYGVTFLNLRKTYKISKNDAFCIFKGSENFEISAMFKMSEMLAMSQISEMLEKSDSCFVYVF